MKKASNLAYCKPNFSLYETIRTYQKKAVEDFATISKHIVEASSGNKRFEVSDNFETRLPLISHHANTALVVVALVKAIEHTICYNSSRDEPSTANTKMNDGASAQSTESAAVVRPLLVCLSNMDRTVSGQYLARPALQRLLRQHTDILLDCWYPEFVDG